MGPKSIFSRLEIRIYLRIFAVAMCMALGLTAFQYQYDYEQRISYLQSEMDRLQKGQLGIVAKHIWNPDPRRIKELFKDLIAASELTYLLVQGEDGDAIVETGGFQDKGRIHGSYPIYHEAEGERVFLGTLVLQIATHHIHSQMQSILTLSLAGNFAKVLVVFVTMMVMVKRYITTRLKAISEYFEAFDPDYLSYSSKLTLLDPKATRPDEVDQLVMGVNRMHKLLLMKSEIIERTTREQREKIDSTESELQKAHDQKANLLRALSHDITNPLTIVLGNVIVCEAAIRNSKPIDEKKITMIKWAANNIKDMIDSVRVADAISSGKMALQLEPVPLTMLLDNAKMMFSDKMANKGIRLAYDAQRFSGLYVEAHATSLSNQVFNNLISNAIKFSNEGSQITVEVSRHESRTIVTLTDKGIGIPEDMVSKLFDGDSAISRKGTHGEKGTGFGLLLIKSCMERFGGFIEVSSRSIDSHPTDHGTTFTLTFVSAEAPSMPCSKAA